MDGATLVAMVDAFAAIVLGAVAVWALFRFRRDLALPEKLDHVSEYLLDEYLDRAFLAPRDNDLTTLKAGRLRAAERCEIEDGRANFLAATLEDGWENQFAYEITLAQNRVGAMVQSGAVPLQTVYMFIAAQVVEDWAYCAELVSSIRKRGGLRALGNSDVPYHRRHGEWLAMACAILLHERWHGCDALVDRVGGIEKVRQRERALFAHEKDLIPPGTRREIRRLLDGRVGWRRVFLRRDVAISAPTGVTEARS